MSVREETILSDIYVRPEVRRFLDWLNALPGPRSHEVSPVEARAMMLASRHVADAATGDLAVIRDLECPGQTGMIPLRLYDARAERAEPGPLLVFYHGGGFVFGDLDTHEPFCAEIARLLDMPVLSVDYRLAPEHPWPAAPVDCIAAARWAADRKDLGGTGLVLAGDSAGGNLAIVVALALRDEPARVPVKAIWPIYPAADPVKGYPSYTDFGEGYLLSRDAMRWFDDCYAPDRRDWRYAPLLRDQKGMPPAMVVTASLDPIRDQGRAFAAALAQAGVPTVFHEAKGNIHGFINLRKAIPSSNRDIAACVAGLQYLLGLGA